MKNRRSSILSQAALAVTVGLTTFGWASAAHAETNDTITPHGAWCGTPQVMPTVAQSPHTPYSAAARVIWLNRQGGSFTVGSNTNSATNVVSSRIFSSGSFVIAPLSNNFNWNTVVACVKEQYKPYNVRFVETKPTSGKYVQAIVGGTGEEIGRGNTLLGIAAADNFCGVTEAGIAFNFAENHSAQNNTELCATVAHEIGHVLSLEHKSLPRDVMSYTPSAPSNPKSFINQEAECGTGVGQQPTISCSCPVTSGGNNTNSAKRLLAALGARPTETIAPTIVLDSPKANATVGPTFVATATATDNVAVEAVGLIVNGFERGTDDMADTGNKFAININDLSEGEHEIIAQVTDTSGNTVRTAPIKITVAKQATGGTCAGNNDCKGSICADDGTQKFCTETCTVENDTCPDGFGCVAVGAGFACYFSAEGDGGSCGCQSGSGGGSVAMLGAFLVGAVLLRKRRAA
ncbi:MAG: hypothetical protein KBG15_17845 [Kofleriaceae bacterium]|nr:hypothetical protein [Kofleriaceae bacterium]